MIRPENISNLTMFFIVFIGFYLSAVSVGAQITVFPLQNWDQTKNTSDRGWVMPEKNSLLVLPPILVPGQSVLPTPENFTTITNLIIEELHRAMKVEVVGGWDVQYPNNFMQMNNIEQIQWITQYGRSKNARTVLRVSLGIHEPQGVPLSRNFGVPLIEGTHVGGNLVLSVLVVDCEIGLGIVELTGEGVASGADVSQTPDLKSFLEREVNAMAQRAALDLASESWIHRLEILRPTILISNIQDKQITLNVGAGLGINKEAGFAAFKPEGSQWIPIARLKVQEVSSNAAVCKVSLLKNQQWTENTKIIPYNEKIAGPLRLPKESRTK